MEKKQGSEGGYLQLSDHGRTEGRVIRLPPKRGRIKREILASVARSVMLAVVLSFEGIGRTGRSLGQITCAVMASSYICCGEKCNSLPSQLHLLRAVRF